ncbi:MAG: glyoxylate/hydroxypyruvate reductase A [Planctomycetota bacterium]|jgi:glyoxylate/hydroxypyruvate reductase A
MALLIDIKNPKWLTDAALRDELWAYTPDADIRIASDPGDPADIDMLTVSSYHRGEALKYPNLKVIQKTGAGVNNILDDDLLPDSVTVTRLEAHISGNEMAEYALAYVLQEQRQLRLYNQHQQKPEWVSYPPRKSAETTVAVLGLGQIGQIIARRFVDNRFKVCGWSRTQKNIDDVTSYCGAEGRTQALNEADYVISVLPSTPQTVDLYNCELFAQFKPGAFFINVGRGDQVNEADLIDALDREVFAGAILDVFASEPLALDNPLWWHPKVQITPHVSGYHLGDATRDIAENFRRLQSNLALLNVVDRSLGY